MELDAFSLGKRFIHVADARVAYADHGDGSPVLLLHGCPFSSFVWRNVIPIVAEAGYRCLAPDLLGLGDTETPSDADWSLPAQLAMVVNFLGALSLERIDVVGHDHGGAIAQLLAVVATQLPVLGALVRLALSSPMTFKLILTAAKAVKDRSVLTDELVTGYVRANLSDAHKRAKTARFLAGQLDPNNNRCTLDAVEGLRRFDHPTMLLWGTEDAHFGPEWADQLAADIPGVRRKELLPTGHLLMEEDPERVSDLLAEFLAPAA
jgi:pimeloyl-ACP methyl ester carboxylesterase